MRKIDINNNNSKNFETPYLVKREVVVSVIQFLSCLVVLNTLVEKDFENFKTTF